MYVGKSLFLVVIWSGLGGYMSFLLNWDKNPNKNVLVGVIRQALFATRTGRNAGESIVMFLIFWGTLRRRM